MNSKFVTYLLLLLFIVSCSEEKATHYTIKGNANNVASDIIVFGLDSRLQKVDSITADEQGNFIYTIESDTVVPFVMVMPDGKEITLFAEQGTTAELSYDYVTQKCSIANAGPIQTLHDSISQVIDACQDKKTRNEAIERFIKQYPISEVNVELLRRYMIDVPNPDYTQIKNFISKLGGILQDNEFLTITKNNIDKKSGNTLHRQFPTFTYTTADSCKEITLNTFNKKHLLVTFWASWDKESRKQMKLLQEIEKSVKSENFDILNIALDHDTTEWKKCVESDSITGYNVCEKEAWSSEIANKFNINTLPYSILVNAYQRVIKVGLDLGKDAVLIDSIVAKHEKSMKEREEREERERREKEKEEKRNKAKKKQNK